MKLDQIIDLFMILPRGLLKHLFDVGGGDLVVIHCFKGFRVLDFGICARNIDIRKNNAQNKKA